MTSMSSGLEMDHRSRDAYLMSPAAGDGHRSKFSSSGGAHCSRSSSQYLPESAVADHPNFFSPIISSDATVCLLLQHDILVQVAPSGAVRVINKKHGGTAGVSAGASAVHVEHGCVARMEYCPQDGVMSMANEDVFAKITKRGCLFTRINHGLVYLVDNSGVKSTTESFVILDDEMSKRYFYCPDKGPSAKDFSACENMIKSSRNYTTNMGTVVWVVDKLRIKQGTDGAVNVYSAYEGDRCCLTTSPAGDIGLRFSDEIKVSMCCPYGGVSSSVEQASKFLDICQGKIKLYSDRRGFHARNGTHTAGFDNEMKFKLG